MAEIVELPKLGLSDQGELVTWEIEVGDRVEAGEILALIESDKASAEIEAPESGVLLAAYVEVGETIPIEPGRPIAAIGEPGETPPDYETLADGETEAGAPSPTDESTAETNGQTTTSDSGQERKVSPRARRFAAEHDVDLAQVQRATGPEGSIVEADVQAHLEDGEAAEPAVSFEATKGARQFARLHGVSLDAVETGSGPGGVITKRDLREYVMTREGDAAAETATAAASGPRAGAEPVGDVDVEASSGTDLVSEDVTIAERRQLSGTRRTIAERLTRSAREKPHVMGTREISVEQLKRARRRLRDEYGVDVSIPDLIVHFVGEVLRELPEFNAYFVDGEHQLVADVNVGYAVDSPKGLVVPVLEDVPNRDLAELADERRELVDAVLADEHTVEDLTDGTFTVTNVGALGMDVSYSIINPPQVAILAIGREKLAPVERGDDVEMESVVTFSLTIDHRVLDGADSGRFLDRLAEKLEYPGGVFETVR